VDEAELSVRPHDRFLAGERGAGAAEFALVLPGLIFLLLGLINTFLMIYAWINLASSAEQAARYAAVSYHASCTTPGQPWTGCTALTQTQVSTYAGQHYTGPSLTKTYTYTTTGTCGAGGNTGNNVAATASYRFYYGFGTISVPINGSACFP
jgi:Flp pilus assembly protein TadG